MTTRPPFDPAEAFRLAPVRPALEKPLRPFGHRAARLALALAPGRVLEREGLEGFATLEGFGPRARRLSPEGWA